MKFYRASGLLFSCKFPTESSLLLCSFAHYNPNFNFITSSFRYKEISSIHMALPTSFIKIKINSSRYAKYNIRSHSDVHVLLMEGLKAHSAWNIKVFIGLTIKLLAPSWASLSTFKNSFIYSFFSFGSFRIFSSRSRLSFCRRAMLTKQVTKSFYEGELRANDRINIFWIDEHEASTWHLSWNSMADERRRWATKSSPTK